MDMPPPEQPPDAAGIVIVDIGGDAGAAVITTPRELVGAEIEIRGHRVGRLPHRGARAARARNHHDRGRIRVAPGRALRAEDQGRRRHRAPRSGRR